MILVVFAANSIQNAVKDDRTKLPVDVFQLFWRVNVQFVHPKVQLVLKCGVHSFMAAQMEFFTALFKPHADNYRTLHMP